MVSAGVCYGGKGRLHFIPDKAKVNAKIYFELCYPNSLKTASLFYRLVSVSSRTVLLLTRQNWLKTVSSVLPPTAVNLLTKMNGHQTQQTLTLLIYIISHITCLGSYA